MNLRGIIKAFTSKTPFPTMTQAIKGYQNSSRPIQALQNFLTSFARNFRKARESLPTDVKNVKTLRSKETKPYHYPLKENNVGSAQSESSSTIGSTSLSQSEPPEIAKEWGKEITKEATSTSGNNAPSQAPADTNKNRHWSDLSAAQKKAVTEKLFESKEGWVGRFVDIDHPFFRDFRQYILKEDPDSPITIDSVEKFSSCVRGREELLARKYKFFKEVHDSKFETAEIFKPSSMVAKDITPSDYLMFVAETDKKDVRRMNYFDESYRDYHAQFFKDGGVSNTTVASYNKFIMNKPAVGRPGPMGGRWVQPTSTIDDLLRFNEKNPDLSLSECLEISLGMPPDSYKNDLVISMKSLDDLKSISLPMADLGGTNKLFREGGYTLGKANPEAHVPVIPREEVAFGVWGLPAHHPLHPNNAKLGNHEEFEAFLNSKENVENLIKQNHTPLRDLQVNSMVPVSEAENLASLVRDSLPIHSASL